MSVELRDLRFVIRPDPDTDGLFYWELVSGLPSSTVVLAQSLEVANASRDSVREFLELIAPGIRIELEVDGDG